MEEDDLALFDRWCAGDAAAGSALFGRHYELVFRFFEGKRETDAADLVQDTFLSCVRARESFRRASSFKTYLLTIARNTLYSYWRKRAVRGDALDFDEVSIAALSTSARSLMARREDHANLLAALRELPLEQQLLLELHYWEDLDGDQLAEVFAIEPATTRSRLFRARQALRDRLDHAADRPAAPPTDDATFDAWARSLAPAPAKVRNTPAGEESTGS